MKKIIWALALSTCFISNTMAEEYIWTNQKIDNLKPIEEEKRYKYYKESIEGEYIKKGVEDKKYTYEEEKNVKYEYNGKYKEECVDSENTICEYREVYPYQNIYRSRYMKLHTIQNDLNIESINIYQGDKKVDFEIIECLYCDNLKIKKDGYMKIDLKDNYAPRTLKLEIKTSNSDRFLYLTAFYNTDEKKAFEIASWSNQTNYTLKDYGFEKSLLSEVKYSTEKVNSDYETYALSPKNMYAEKDIYTYRYNITKTYYDSNYHSFLQDESYIKDENDYVIYYKYLASSINDDNGDYEGNQNNQDNLNNYNDIEKDETNFTNDLYEEKIVNTGLSKDYEKSKITKLVKILLVYISLFSALFVLIALKIKNKMSN